MKFGFPIWYGNRPYKAAIEKAHKMGFDYIEFDLNSPWPEKLTKEELNPLKNLGEYGLEIAFHGPLFGIDIAHLSDKISEASLNVILDAIKFSEAFQPLYFNFHLSSHSNPHLLEFEMIRNEIYKKALDNITRIINNTKIDLVLENNGGNPIFKTLEDFSRLKNYNLNFCFDVGHATKCKFLLEKSGLQILWGLKDWLNSFKNKILVAHLHDCLIKGTEAVDHIPIGSGNIKFDEVFGAIKNTKCKYALIEIHRTIEGTITEKHFKQNLDYCKSNLK